MAYFPRLFAIERHFMRTLNYRFIGEDVADAFKLCQATAFLSRNTGAYQKSFLTAFSKSAKSINPAINGHCHFRGACR